MRRAASGHRSRSSRGRSVTRVPRTFRENDSDEDHSSWIADDICTRCGAHAPHGKLYCSTRCWDEDARLAQATKSDETSPSRSLADLRYPMSISPHNSNLVSCLSSLTLCKSAPSGVRSRRPDTPLSDDDPVVSRPAHIRQSSASSHSSFEENELETTTPSPWQTGIEMDDEDLNQLDDAELELPPSILATNHVLLRQGVTRKNAQVVPTVPVQSPTIVPHRVRFRNEMQFSRKPGATSMPSPVVFTSNTTAPNIMSRTMSEGAVLDETQGREGESSRLRKGPASGSTSTSALRSSSIARENDVHYKWKNWKETHIAVPDVSKSQNGASDHLRAIEPRQVHSRSPGTKEEVTHFECRGRGLQRTGNACCARDQRSPLGTVSVSPVNSRP